MARQLPARRFTFFTRYWLAVLLYLGVIFTLSAQPHLRAPIEFQNSDKLYHLMEYGGLGLLMARALRSTLPGISPIALGLAVIGLGIVIAASDERFQSTVPGRESSAYDALADTLGVTAAQWLYWRRPRRAEK